MSSAACEADHQGAHLTMRNILISSALILSLAGGASAVAATKPAPAKTTPATSSKTADCNKQWKAEKKHSQTKKAFMAACTKA